MAKKEKMQSPCMIIHLFHCLSLEIPNEPLQVYRKIRSKITLAALILQTFDNAV